MTAPSGNHCVNYVTIFIKLARSCQVGQTEWAKASHYDEKSNVRFMNLRNFHREIHVHLLNLVCLCCGLTNEGK